MPTESIYFDPYVSVAVKHEKTRKQRLRRLKRFELEDSAPLRTLTEGFEQKEQDVLRQGTDEQLKSLVVNKLKGCEAERDAVLDMLWRLISVAEGEQQQHKKAGGKRALSGDENTSDEVQPPRKKPRKDEEGDSESRVSSEAVSSLEGGSESRSDTDTARANAATDAEGSERGSLSILKLMSAGLAQQRFCFAFSSGILVTFTECRHEW